MRTIAVTAITVGLLFPGVGASQAQSRTRKPAAGKTASKPLPPLITITSDAPDAREAQVRLSQFIRVLQEDNRLRAVRFFSSRVPAAERQAFLQKKWLLRVPSQRDDLHQLLFQPDLQIHTQRVYKNSIALNVTARRIPMASPRQAKSAAGIVEVLMRKERGQWWVELRQPRRG